MAMSRSSPSARALVVVALQRRFSESDAAITYMVELPVSCAKGNLCRLGKREARDKIR